MNDFIEYFKGVTALLPEIWPACREQMSTVTSTACASLQERGVRVGVPALSTDIIFHSRGCDEAAHWQSTNDICL